MKRAREYEVYKTILLLEGHKFNVVDIDIATGQYLGFYTNANGLLLGNYTLDTEIDLVLRPADK